MLFTQKKEVLEAKRHYKEEAAARDYSNCACQDATNASVLGRGHCGSLSRKTAARQTQGS